MQKIQYALHTQPVGRRRDSTGLRYLLHIVRAWPYFALTHRTAEGIKRQAKTMTLTKGRRAGCRSLALNSANTGSTLRISTLW